MATMAEIARLAGVSRGTVDRVLNNRGGVGKETEERVMRVAEQLQYSPNKAARVLSGVKEPYLLTYVLPDPALSPLFAEVECSILQTAEMYRDTGVEVKVSHLPRWETEALLTALDGAVAAGSAGIVVYGAADHAVVEKIRTLTSRGTPVVTVGMKVPACGQLAYVGSDAFQAGETAGGMLHLLQRKPICIGAVVGSSTGPHRTRLEGIFEALRQNGRFWTTTFTVQSLEDDFECFDLVREQLLLHPETNTVVLSTANVYGACRAIERLGERRPRCVICFDTTPSVREMLDKGVITACIGQQPARQGREPLEILSDYLLLGMRPERDEIYVENEIFICENL